ncbi:hypothetical protein [uncultured Sutterella sp.]|uniref:hypothetical protein n=1 Tax=uncultured Sutterella sp. TaxID=286133 RepID=UPI0025FCEB28|nr:hypothetical protein [uncultured Sutterella sp.]
MITLRHGLLRRGVEIPLGAHFAFGALHDDRIAAGLLDLDVAHDDRRAVGVDFLSEVDLVALENLLVVRAVDLDRDVLAGGDLVELDLEVEARVRHEAGLIDRVDLGGVGGAAGRGGDEGRKGGLGEESLLHGE